MSESVCGSIVSTRRGLLAFVWSCVTLLTFIAFVTALLFSIYSNGADDNDGYDDQYNYNNQEQQEGGSQDQQQDQEEEGVQVAVTSRAMVFAASWTAVLASLMAVFGTVILGIQSPTGEYYTCCDPNVHQTTQLGLGSFIGALLMFANLTLVCSVLFGEFEIRDYRFEGEGDQDEDGEQQQQQEYEHDSNFQRSSMAFSIMCMFLTVLYLGFSILTYLSATTVLQEQKDDGDGEYYHNGSNRNVSGGMIHNGRFDVMPATKKRSGTSSGFGFAPPPTERQAHLLPSNDFVGAQTPLSMTESQGSNSTPLYREPQPGYVEPNPLFESGVVVASNTGSSSGFVEPNPLFDTGASQYVEPNPFQSQRDSSPSRFVETSRGGGPSSFGETVL